jgi:hypothetical protein
MLCKLSKVIQTVDDLHLKHGQLAESYQKERDSSVWNRAEENRLKGILYSYLLSVIGSTISTFLLCSLNYRMLIVTLAEINHESLLAEISQESLVANNLL